jgi:hypothetical protein
MQGATVREPRGPPKKAAGLLLCLLNLSIRDFGNWLDFH